jgi:hypothetical protein
MSSNNPPAGQNNPTTSTQAQTSSASRTSQGKPLEKVPAKDSQSITKLPEILGEHNWSAWKDRMQCALRHCGVAGYANGTITCPTDTDQAEIWDYNDNYAQHIILINVADSKMIYVGWCETAHAVWEGLAAVHETTAHQTVIAIIRNLFHTIANDDSNITDHLNMLCTYWERINMLGDNNFKISELFFKIIISSLLPLAWDTFTEPYISGRKGDAIQDPKRAMTSAQFIGILKEEYDRRTARAQGPESTSGQTTNLSMQMPGNLASRIGRRLQNAASPSHGQNANNNTRMYCRQCRINNHNTVTCHFLGARSSIYCDNCEKYGHKTDKCWRRDGNNALRRKQKRGNGGDGGGGKGKKKAKAERANAATEESNVAAANIEEKAELTFVVEEGGILFDETEVGQYSGFDNYNPLSGNDYHLLWYDWVADSATTSHICNAREAFAEYSPADGITVAGVGNTKMSVAGHGTVKLHSCCEGWEYNLRLENVLHILYNQITY